MSSMTDDDVTAELRGRRRSREVPLTLRQVLLRSVGPPDARFDPLTLSMTSTEPVTKVLWALTNTGGKTTLLRLVYSVIVTRSAVQMGGANIGDFVEPGDTAHVVLEWDGPSGRFVTGAVYEWPGRIRPARAAMSELNRWHYTFRLAGDDQIEPGSLPFTTPAGTKATLAQFRAETQELFRDRPSAMFNADSQHGKWREILETTTPLDPTLFQYQMRMNSDEGGADALVEQLTTPDAFVRFFVQALNEDAKLVEFTQGVAQYATRAGQRQSMEREALLCSEVGSALEMLDVALRRVASAGETRRYADVLGGELAASIRGRIVTLRREVEAAEGAASAAQAELAGLTTETNRHDDIRAQVLYRQAQFRQLTAEEALAAAERNLEAATAELEAWQAVPVVKGLLQTRAEEDAARQAYERAEEGLAPLRAAADEVAGRLAATFAALAAKADGEASDARARYEEADRIHRDARTKHTAAVTAAGTARHEEDGLRSQIVAAEKLLSDLRAGGLLEAGEALPDAVVRIDGLVAEARTTVSEAHATRAATHARRDRFDERLSSATEVLTAARRVVNELDTISRRLESEVAGLSADDIVSAVAGGDVDGPEHAHRLAGAVRDRDEAARTSLQASNAQFEQVSGQLDGLDRDDLLEPHTDVRHVLSVLAEAGVSATGGWAWIAENVADVSVRRAVIERHPELAGGVVVASGRLDRARDVLREAGMAPVLAVAVTDVTATAPVLTAQAAPEGRFVVDPHPALYDPDRAADMRDELRRTLVTLEESIEAEKRLVTLTGAARALLDGFLTRWPADFEAGHLAAVDDAASELEAAEEIVAGIEAERAPIRDAIGAAAKAYDGAKDELRDRTDAASELRRAEPVVGASRDAREKFPDVASRRQSFESSAEREEARAETAEGQRQDATVAQTRAEGNAQQFRRAQRDVGVESADEPGQDPVDVQTAELAERRRVLIAAERGSDHSERLTTAQQRVADALVRVDAIADTAVAAAQLALGELDAADPLSTQVRIDRCDELRIGAARAAEAAANRLEAARQVTQGRAPSDDRVVHAVLSDDWEPTSADHAEELRQRVDEVLGDLRARTTEQNAVKLRADNRVRDLGTLVTQFEASAQRWTGTDAVTAGAVADFAGTPAEAIVAVDTARETLDARTRDHADAEREASEAFDLMRGAVHDQRWEGVSSTVKETCDKAPRDVVYANAAGWAHTLRIRERSLRDDLRDLDVYRTNIVVTLHQLTSEQLRLLNQVGSFSKLPAAAGGLAGNPAIKISFTRLPEPEARARLAELVDEWAQRLAASDRKTPDVETRVRWLCEAARRVVKDRSTGTPWKVEVLKPTVDGTLIYRTPDRIKEFSGGQELTLAILVYITLAGVRAANRIGGRRPPVPLLSDNPFGKASNEALIRTQHALADAADVQLVCASGIDHPDVLSAFEGPDAVVIRLRNDRAQRTGLRHLRIVDPDVSESVVAKLLGDREIGDLAGYVNATSYQVRR